MTEIIIGTEAPPPGTRVVTIHGFVALPPDEDDWPPWHVELFGEIEHVVQTLGFSYASLGVYDGHRWLIPAEPEGTMENLQDPVLDQEEPLTPAELARKEKIAVENELIERQKEFHLLTACFIMDRDNYQRIRRALSEQEPPEGGWEPVVGDMHNGYPIIVREDGGTPHLEMVDRPLRPSQFAGVSTFGVELPMEFQAKDEKAAAASIRAGQEAAQEEQASDDAAPASEH